MKRAKATKKQRIFSWLIDAIIVGGIGFLIGFLISKFSGVESWVNGLYDEYKNALKAGNDSVELLEDLLVAHLARTGIYATVYLVVVFGYLVILPYYVSWQTVGRLITGCRLIELNTEAKPKFKSLIIREVVGEYLMYILLTLLLFAWNIVFWLSAMKAVMKNASFPDRFSKLKLVDKEALAEVEEEISFEPEEYEYSDDYDWEKDNETVEVLDMETIKRMREENDIDETQVKK